MILIIAAALPVIFLCTLFYIKDTQREPVRLLIKAFITGIIIVIPAIIFGLILDAGIKNIAVSKTVFNFLQAFVVAALVEEVLKFSATRWLLKNNKYFDQHYDGIVYAVFVSLGFAFLENIFYVVEHGMGTAVVRCLFSVPGHAFFGVFMGYYLSLYYKGDVINKQSNLTKALIVPIVLHGLFDFFLMDFENKVQSESIFVLVYMVLFLGLNFWFWRYGFKRINKLVAHDKSNNANFDNNIT